MYIHIYIYLGIDKIIQQFFHRITDRKKFRKHLLYLLLLSTLDLSILIFPHKENYNIILCQIIALWGMQTSWEDNCLPLKALICWRYNTSSTL